MLDATRGVYIRDPMRKWLDRYYGPLRQLKLNYVLLNLFNLKKLRHARRMYKKYGIHRSVLLPISSEALPKVTTHSPWLDADDATQKLNADSRLQRFDAATREAIEHWPANGYMILRGCFTATEVKAINTEIDRLIAEKIVDFNFTGRKVMFAFQHSDLLKKVVHDRRMLSVLDFTLGKAMKPFQSINFLTGSEQAAHSDSIHMTTYPLGYLSAAWIALEEMTPDNGPLIFYPGSHKLPYLLNGSFDHGGNRFVIGNDAYAHYEEAVDKAIAGGKFERKEFIAQAGDVLIWHANLLHGGKKMSKLDASRKSMAIHYFADDVLCYHELTQRVAQMDD